MSTRQFESVASAFFAKKAMADAFARLHATSLADSLFEWIRKLAEYDESAAEHEVAAGPTIVEDETAFDAAPAWIRDAHERGSHPDAERIADEDVRPRIVRNRIIAALQENNMTQADLAKTLGKKATSISRILKDPTKSRISTLREIAEALGLDVSEII